MRRLNPLPLRPLAAVILGAFLAACAGVQPQSQEERVEQRAQQRWNHLLAGEFEQAYRFFSPGQRTSVSLQNYQRRMLLSKVRYTGATVADADCGEDTCTVRVDVGVSLASPVPGVKNYQIERPVTESWVLAENQWWYVPR